MSVCQGNENIASYYTTKHSWRGKYKRIFSVGSKAITTYNPNTLEITNQWAYTDFFGIQITPKPGYEFTITIRKGKKSQTMTFSTEYRADVITEALRFRGSYATDREKRITEDRYVAYKQHWSDTRVQTILQVTPASLDQINPATGNLTCSYDYKDIEGITTVSDCPGGFAVIHGGFGRLHVFASESRDEILRKITELSLNVVGYSIRVRKNPITLTEFEEKRLGKFSDDEHITSLSEFRVQKITNRYPDPTSRLFCLTETCIIERDPATYNIVTCRPFGDIYALIRYSDNPQKFAVEYIRGQIRKYYSTERDSLLASVLDGARAGGNSEVCVKMLETKRGLRFGPFHSPVDEDIESLLLKWLQTPPSSGISEAIERFNANISYSGLLYAVTQEGLFAENKEKLINGALIAFLLNERSHDTLSNDEIEAQFHVLRRIVASKIGFQAFTTLPSFREKIGGKILKSLKRNNDGISHAAIDMLCALMQPMHANYDLRQEQLNKSSLLSSSSFVENLLKLLASHVDRGTGALVVSALLDFITFALCAPYSETTDGAQFDTVLELVADLGRSFFRLFEHPSLAILKAAGLIMKSLIEEGNEEVSTRLQELALSEGALPRHVHIAMFTSSTDGRMLTLRQLSRHLVSLWTEGNPKAMELFGRILPAGLVAYLESSDVAPDDDIDRMHVRDNMKLAKVASSKNKKSLQRQQIEALLIHWKTRLGRQKPEPTTNRPVVLRKRRQRLKVELNWQYFFYKFYEDHSNAWLIWNYKTREELREALEMEMRLFMQDRELSQKQIISWNHVEFEVRYESLSEEIKIGDYYLRLLLEDDESVLIKQSYQFFNDLYHRFLLSPKPQMKALCLQAMAIVYGKCYEEIGVFNDTRYIVKMIERTIDKLERDRLLFFVHKLINRRENVKAIMDANGVRIFVDLLTLSHLHVTRATVPLQTNVIEAAPDMARDTEKEWYYGNADKERLGPSMREFWASDVLRPTTRCWAQGMDGWRPLHSIPQLKWCLMATGTAVMNETDMAVLILNILNKMCEYYPNKDEDGAIVRPMPRIKRMLSDQTCLPHLVQLFLTFDPIIVEKTALLLHSIVMDNPILPRLYLSGAFFFIMMYTGSNVLPIGKFLVDTHNKQAFRSDEEQQASDVVNRSILSQMLPEAMVCYIENYGANKFAEVFLGEFDTPETIWNTEMRRMMIEKLASHLADFTPRLLSNTRALYQYCPLPRLTYPQLENELFCNIYYLRALCDIARFPDWPIKDPIKLLKDVLMEWKKEVEKKGSSMSSEEAYKILGLETGVGGHEESKVRKAYFKLAQKYHPDKNPEGREMFETINKAYEFLGSKSEKKTDGPDPNNIVLVLRTQSILYSRYKEDLAPYKYAGYPMLIKTIRLETQDDTLFSKSAPLLTAASELAYHTIDCSALNAEELRRENGFEALQEAFDRCIAVLGPSTEPESVSVQVCKYVIRCFEASAQFDACREKLQELPIVIKDIARTMYFKNLTVLCTTATDCVSALAIDTTLQAQMLAAGVVWHLLLYLFNYDYTLDEGGVEASTDTNQQLVANNLAKLSIRALIRLAGFQTPGSIEKTPDNTSIKKCVSAMLTPYVTKQLELKGSVEILKLLNSNSENPYLIWDNATRAQLIDYLEKEQSSMIRSGECDPSYGKDFTFDAHEKELIIGDIFVRIYNKQSSFPLENGEQFCSDLLNFLGSEAEYLHSLMALAASGQEVDSNSARLVKSEMALEALRNVIKNNPACSERCIGHFKLLFSLLCMESDGNLQQMALEVINNVAGNKKCVQDIADADVLSYLFLVVEMAPDSQVTVMEVLIALSSNTKIVKDCMSKGAVIYLLHLFCNSTSPEVRQSAAELLAKLTNDKLVGPKVRILLSKFLPVIFIDAMRDSAEASVYMFESSQENPELIWNEETREKVSKVVQRMEKDFYHRQKDNISTTWKLPENFAIVYTNIEGELTVGGVFLRLFISQPAWVLRKPREFLIALTEKFSQLIGSTAPDTEVLETVTTAIVAFFNAQPLMMDQLPSLGHIPRFFQSMSSRNDAIPKASVTVVHTITSSDICIRAMTETECIGSVMVAMKKRPDIIGLACEAYYNMFEHKESAFVQQALKAEVVPYLLSLLDCGLETVPNAASTKAQIVKALKAMAMDLQHGEQIAAILEQSSVWASYKDQKHDLFIQDTNIAGYLTGPVGTAGYLTAGPAHSSNLPDAPPPLQNSSIHQEDDD
ncbi:uncharacterized protein TRIADDRAFT_21978 [Trichoplax adhaerens]|uniref:J domain-containing protein n=1 Tax=Trichoplax adhaerens TaxID=10228 RepID=B3RR77_TRIAD|nr:hypothetical protein TRIADDRAFT_21978 [Trichoplax adhaerens]EDV26296.1 hypothetical protein TRIADDRAFT_21978 [Trichoplax adhaerens]|eukprot:XP_002110292.1 hypothetical protein TRIADDRAFT_21978 [Trichoplax adhaerens]